MNMRWALSLPMWTFMALVVFAVRAEAQGYAPAGPGAFSPETPGAMMTGGGYGGPEMAMGGGMPPGAMGMQGGMPGGPMGMPGYGGPEYGGPDGGYGGGAEDCGPSHGLLRDFFGLVGPYADGGACAPRFFDVSVEAMFLQRNGERSIILASDGIGGNAALSTDQFRFDERPSFRFTGWIPFRSLGNLEFTYYGLFRHQDSVQVNDPGNNLFSVFSQFGTVPFGGFLEESNAAFMRQEIASEFNSYEANYRRHWQGVDCRLQGSWLLGFRYFQFEEDFSFISVSTLNGAQLRSTTSALNNLMGVQTGGDTWVCIVPGMRVGVEGKAGVYANDATQFTRITATTLAVPFQEEASSNDVAFVGDASLYFTYRMNYQLNLKFGLNMLYVDGLALGAENFNATPPALFVAGSGRQATVNDNGDVFYTGASIGMEYNW